MKSFLEIIAKDLLKKHGEDLSSLNIVFPNKRASLFLNASLAENCEKPIWSPQYTTISELFRSQSKLEIADRIQLVCELYKSYSEVTGSSETLDQFYSWGELMLTDFDDIDKHLADAGKIFILLGNLHELDSIDYLTEEQQEVIQKFFKNFSKEHNSELKKRFLQLWNRFGEIYNNYRSRLFSQGIAYEGMLYRDVIEHLSDEDDNTLTAEKTHYIFVGFNLLNPVEEKMFLYLMKNGDAKFYWDFDEYYMKPGYEAGKYISQYLRIFPNELDSSDEIYKQFGEKDDITFISSPTEDLQARYISQWLTPERIKAGRKTAIILADESLLETVLHCLPKEVQHVNITTGYPLAQSPAASIIRIMLTLLHRKSYTLHSINGILRHPYAKHISPKAIELYKSLNNSKIYHPHFNDIAIDENLKQLFSPLNNPDNITEINERLMWIVKQIARNINKNDQFTSEALYRMYTILNRLSTILESFPITFELYSRLLLQVIQLTTIPFHGEPIEGIQIMGVLETRNLDFEHVLILSCNEGNIPAKVNDSSFIPHSIRKAYELTTVDNKVAIYAYYFHRMLQRASNAHILYNSSTNDGNTGEMSRFMLQMLAESPLHINRKTLKAGQDTKTNAQERIEKTDDIIDKLLSRKSLSPSALGKYLRCPISFFYRYITGISDDNESDEEEMDNQAFGNIFHRAAELTYKSLEGRMVTKEYLDRLLNEKGHTTIKGYVDQAFREKLFRITDEKRPTPRLGGLQVINREMVITFLLNLLKYDRDQTPFEIVGLEKEAYASIEIDTVRGKQKIRIGGIIDRLDLVANEQFGAHQMRVIDYKTGSYHALNMPSIEAIFDPTQIRNHSDYYLQALMYSGIVAGKHPYPVSPALLYIQQVGKEGYSPLLNINRKPITNAVEHLDEYRNFLKELIEKILNPDIPFKPTEDTSRCEHCAYRQFCK